MAAHELGAEGIPASVQGEADPLEPPTVWVERGSGAGPRHRGRARRAGAGRARRAGPKIREVFDRDRDGTFDETIEYEAFERPIRRAR